MQKKRKAKINLLEKQLELSLAIFLAIELAAGIYLLGYDSYLYSAPLHWIGLLTYLVLSIALFVIVFSTKMRTSMYIQLAWGIVSILWFILIFVDAVFNLPYSGSVTTTQYYGFKYLFGFGAQGTYSSFPVSISVLLMVISAFEIFVLSIIKYRREK